MKVLGIDSSGLVAGVAVVENETLLAEYNLNYKKTHSQTLLPMLDEVRRMLQLDLDSIDAVAIASGPGSFTGLRIGSATAKGLGLALEKPLVEVPTLEGLAFNLYGTDCLVCPMLDARRDQVYSGIYEFADVAEDRGDGRTKIKSRLNIVKEQAADSVSSIIMEINRLGETYPGRKVIFLGDGAWAQRERIEDETKIPYRFAPASHNRQRAGSIAALGAVYYGQGRFVSAAEHRPEYLRKSQAERERNESL